MVQIYLDKEAVKILDELKEGEEKFNFSGWIKEQLVKYIKQDEVEDVVELNKSLEEIKVEELKLKNKEEYIREKIARARLQQEELKEVQKHNMTVQELRENARHKTFMSFAPNFIEEESKENLEVLAHEFKKGVQDVRRFLEEKGYLENKEEEEDVCGGVIEIRERQAQTEVDKVIQDVQGRGN